MGWGFAAKATLMYERTMCEDSGLKLPRYICPSAIGLVISDLASNALQLYSFDGAWVKTIAESLQGPSGVTCEGPLLWVCEGGSHRVVKLALPSAAAVAGIKSSGAAGADSATASAPSAATASAPVGAQDATVTVAAATAPAGAPAALPAAPPAPAGAAPAAELSVVTRPADHPAGNVLTTGTDETSGGAGHAAGADANRTRDGTLVGAVGSHGSKRAHDLWCPHGVAISKRLLTDERDMCVHAGPINTSPHVALRYPYATSAMHPAGERA